MKTNTSWKEKPTNQSPKTKTQTARKRFADVAAPGYSKPDINFIYSISFTEPLGQKEQHTVIMVLTLFSALPVLETMAQLPSRL